MNTNDKREGLTKPQAEALHELEKHPRPVAMDFHPKPHHVHASTARSLLRLGLAVRGGKYGEIKITRAGSEALARSRGWRPK